jgi:hypothetical protein
MEAPRSGTKLAAQEVVCTADVRVMKRATVLAIPALLILLGAAYVQGAVPGTSGCALRSVDKSEYVAQNDAVFSTIRLPRYLRAASMTTYSIATPAKNACLPLENSPPYEAYITWHVFLPGKGQTKLGFDRRMLGPKWVSQLGGPTDETFRRGRASLYVTHTNEATSFAVDYRGYDR